MPYRKTTPCRYCSTQLYFEKNDNGKFVPMEYSSNEPHDCPDRPHSDNMYYEPKPVYCNYCDKRIMFKETVKSPTSGKFIPLNYSEIESAADYNGKYTPHRCAENPYYNNDDNNNNK